MTPETLEDIKDWVRAAQVRERRPRPMTEAEVTWAAEELLEAGLAAGYELGVPGWGDWVRSDDCVLQAVKAVGGGDVAPGRTKALFADAVVAEELLEP